jgi:hypothetical protein
MRPLFEASPTAVADPVRRRATLPWITIKQVATGAGNLGATIRGPEVMLIRCSSIAAEPRPR